MKTRMIIISLLLGVTMLVTGCGNQNNTGQKGQKGDEISMDALKGTWHGSIKIPKQPLPIIVSFQTGKSKLEGTISIPVQAVKDYPLSNVKMDQSHLSFGMDIQGQHITFDGAVKKDAIEGTFTQHGQSFPFELKRGKAEGKASNTEDSRDKGQFLSVETDKGKLYGELETPKGTGPYPVMIIIPGSGPTDRNGNSNALPGKNNSLKMLAQQLAKHGIASVRYDKRGVGKNLSAVIPEKDLRFDQFVKDADAWVNRLNQDQRFSKVGIIGHSQGSLVGIKKQRLMLLYHWKGPESPLIKCCMISLKNNCQMIF